jgi:hypothetical protein
MNLRMRVAMAEATSSELHERQRALRQRLAVLKAGLLRLAGPGDARDLGWFSPPAPEPPRPKPLAWSRPRTDPAVRS